MERERDYSRSDHNKSEGGNPESQDYLRTQANAVKFRTNEYPARLREQAELFKGTRKTDIVNHSPAKTSTLCVCVCVFSPDKMGEFPDWKKEKI